jgi:NAD(P)H dehydrogenase (quinone)
MSHALVVFCHPIRESFGGAILDAVLGSLTTSGVDCRVIDLYADDFEPVLSLAEWQGYHTGSPSVSPQLQGYIDSLRWADSLVLVYPTWFGSQPAMLKGWFDRVFLPGVAFALPKRWGPLRPGLANIRSLTVVTTHGSSKLLNSVQGEPGKRVALRGMRALCHWRCRTDWVAFYGNDQAVAEVREGFLNRVKDHFS